MLLRGPPAVEENVPPETIYDPVKGVDVPVTDHDGLIDAWERIDELYRKLKARRDHFRLALWKRTSGATKTRRVRGHRRCVRLTEADESLDQKRLKDANDNYPEFANDFLRIERLAVRKREFKKADSTAGTERFNKFVKLVASAIGKPTGLPSVKVEE